MNIVSSSPDLFLSATTPVGMAHFVIIEDSVAPLKRCLRHDGAVCGVVLWPHYTHWPKLRQKLKKSKKTRHVPVEKNKPSPHR
jgi:hypothetical protein